METARFDQATARRLVEPSPHDRFFRRTARVARVLSLATTRVEVPDDVELPLQRPLLFAANHSSLFDLPASVMALDRFGLTTRLGINARFFRNRAAGAFLERLGAIPFSREEREVAEGAMVATLLAGQPCALMPEGRIVRHADRVDGVGQGRPGVSRIARRAGAAVIPVGIAGSDRAWPPGSPFVRVGWRRPPVRIAFGPPLLFETDDHIANTDRLMTAIAALLPKANPPRP